MINLEKPKYALGEEVKIIGWTSSAKGIVNDIKSVYHNRLCEFCWGYNINFTEGSNPFSSEYIPEGYLNKLSKE